MGDEFILDERKVIDMYEKYSRQALPSKVYRELLGSSICVFNSNNSFIIENILSTDTNQVHSWYDLIDMESGKLLDPIKETITERAGTDIARKFQDLIAKRNRIIHSFQITDSESNEQILATKDKHNVQFRITEEYLFQFIKDNEELTLRLHDYRGF